MRRTPPDTPPGPLRTDRERGRIGALYERYGLKLLFVALKIVKDKALAEDAVHSTFEAVIRHKEKILLMDDRNFLRWSVTVVEHKCIDILRKYTHIADTPLDELEKPPASNEMPVDLQVLREIDVEQIHGLLARFDETDRTILVMRYLSQFSYREIGAALGFTAKQVDHRLTRIRARLRKLTESEVPFDA
jgi:RNA polymerase sigma-70 factor (ECF subfamily)